MMVLNVADDVNGTLSEKKKKARVSNGREKKAFLTSKLVLTLYIP